MMSQNGTSAAQLSMVAQRGSPAPSASPPILPTLPLPLTRPAMTLAIAAQGLGAGDVGIAAKKGVNAPDESTGEAVHLSTPYPVFLP